MALFTDRTLAPTSAEAVDASKTKKREKGFGAGEQTTSDESTIRSTRLEHAQCVLAALFGRSPVVDNPRTASGVNRYRNFIIMDSQNPSTMISTIHGIKEAEEFFKLPSTLAANLVPKIRIFGVDEKQNKSEYLFNLSDYGADNISSQLANTPLSNKKGTDAGIMEVKIEDLTSTPAEEGVTLVAKIKLYFKNLGTFLTKKATADGKYTFADLVMRQVSASDSYDPLNNQIILHVGYQLPHKSLSAYDLGISPESLSAIKRAILKSVRVYRLHLREHIFNFSEDGSVELEITYNAAVDGIANDRRTDLMMNVTEQTIIATKREELDRLRKKIAKEKKNSSSNDVSEEQKQVKDISSQIQKITNNLKDESMSRFLDELFGLAPNSTSYIKKITVPSALLGAISNDENVKSQGIKKLRSEDCKTYNNLLRTVDIASDTSASGDKVDAVKDLQSAINKHKGKGGKGGDSDTRKRQKDLDEANGRFSIKSSTSSNASGIAKAQKAVQAAIGKNSEFSASDFYDIAFFHYGDLVEVALKIMRREQGPFYQKYIKEGLVDLFPTPILGPILMRENSCGGQKIRRSGANMADVPISVDFFIDFMTNKFIKPARSNLFFKEFITVLNKSVLPGALGETCRLESSGQNVQFGHTMPITVKRQGSSDSCLGFPTADGPPGRNYLTEAHAKSRMSYIDSLSGALSSSKTKEYMLIYVPNYAFTNLRGDRTQDLAKGIYHLKAGASNSIIKNFSIDGNTQPFMAEAMSFPENGKPQLGRDVAGGARYDLNLEMLGHTFLRIGTPFYFDITSLALGSPNNLKSLANRLGIGGYYQTNKINYTITPSEFFVSFNAMFMGSSPELQASEADIGKLEVETPEPPGMMDSLKAAWDAW